MSTGPPGARPMLSSPRVFISDSDARYATISRNTELLDLYYYAVRVVTSRKVDYDYVVATMYKRKADKVKPVNDYPSDRSVSEGFLD